MSPAFIRTLNCITSTTSDQQGNTRSEHYNSAGVVNLRTVKHKLQLRNTVELLYSCNLCSTRRNLNYTRTTIKAFRVYSSTAMEWDLYYTVRSLTAPVLH